jgi:hypothetical protein
VQRAMAVLQGAAILWPNHDEVLKRLAALATLDTDHARMDWVRSLQVNATCTVARLEDAILETRHVSMLQRSWQERYVAARRSSSVHACCEDSLSDAFV